MLSAFLTYNVKAQKKKKKTEKEAKNPFTTLKMQINLHINQHFYLMRPYSYEIYISFLQWYCSVSKAGGDFNERNNWL